MDIRKDHRNKGNFYHKTPRGINATLAKEYASKDISKYCAEDKSWFTRNYLIIENLILKYNSTYPKNLSIK